LGGEYSACTSLQLYSNRWDLGGGGGSGIGMDVDLDNTFRAHFQDGPMIWEENPRICSGS